MRSRVLSGACLLFGTAVAVAGCGPGYPDPAGFNEPPPDAQVVQFYVTGTVTDSADQPVPDFYVEAYLIPGLECPANYPSSDSWTTTDAAGEYGVLLWQYDTVDRGCVLVNFRRSRHVGEPPAARHVVTLLFQGGARNALPDTVVVDAVISDES